MTDPRTQALAAQYSRFYGSEEDSYHLGAMPAETCSAAPTAEQTTRESVGVGPGSRGSRPKQEAPPMPDSFDSADGQTHSYGDGCNPPHDAPPDHTTITRCPQCGIQATVLEDRVPALLDRWRREHAEHDEAERRDYAKGAGLPRRAEMATEIFLKYSWAYCGGKLVSITW